MYNIIEQKQRCWNERLKKCIQDAGYTQKSFAHNLNERYGTQFTQKTISRWVNLGDARNGIKGFPEFDNMVYIADYLKVDIGYLTGEIDNETFTLEQVCSVIGLNQNAIEALVSIMHPFGKYEDDDMMTALNIFFTSTYFHELCEAISYLNISLTKFIKSKQVTIPKFKCEDEKEQWINNISDQQMELSGVVKIARYYVQEAFTLLLNDAFDAG
ncbi:helix-turn-helix domain-containing protein [Granulicatella seriolae]|uniref:Helix-turn-helix domain-containing protein n=1 Tax=Granulicatella seriolae TaxID=2967226 RepID=A0ABT1WLM7_9LACT|nr:helix-turn-helix transcriptional regulator [Granulicatella seriolae]